MYNKNMFKLCENFENFENSKQIENFEKLLVNELGEVECSIIDDCYCKYYLINNYQVEFDNEKIFLLFDDNEESKIEIVNDSKLFENLKNLMGES